MITSKLPRRQEISADFPLIFDDASIFPNALETILVTICKEVNSTFSKGLLESIIKKDWDKVIADADIDPLSYQDARSYFRDAQIVALIKKYPHWNIKAKPKVEAMKTFIACELLCRQTNLTIRSENFSNKFSAECGILYLAQKKIASILGDTPCLDDLQFAFGPGAAYGVKYNTSALHKLGSTLDVSKNCHELAAEMLATCPGWKINDEFFFVGPTAPPQLNVVVGDRLSFVPKTAKTDRPIAIGPLLNVLIQKGIGTVIRQKLKPVNNLNNRQGYHREQARIGSIDNSNCTIDLKSASDTIAYAFVEDMLPPAWFDLLDKARSQRYEIQGDSYEYSKFSAMGNGYTFELESLLFFAIAFATCEYYGFETKDVSVFGDDIIAPNAAFDPIKRVLEKVGFTVNSNKSFSDGPFRESCGGDFFGGIDVRPFYLKDRVTYRTLFLFHNFLVNKGWQFELPNTYRLIRKLIGKVATNYFKTWNNLDDGALLDFSMPVGNYNSIKSRYKGLKANALKRTYGASYCLYRLQLADNQSSNDIDWKSHYTRTTRIVHRLYRYVHI